MPSPVGKRGTYQTPTTTGKEAETGRKQHVFSEKSMKYAIQIQGMPNGRPTPIDGQYVKEFDFEYNNGQGSGVFTPNREDAMHFDDMEAAIGFWQTQPKCRPIRWDGKPNRPLTATNVSIEPFEN